MLWGTFVYLRRAAVLGVNTNGDVAAGVPVSHGHGTLGNRYPAAEKPAAA